MAITLVYVPNTGSWLFTALYPLLASLSFFRQIIHSHCLSLMSRGYLFLILSISLTFVSIFLKHNRSFCFQCPRHLHGQPTYSQRHSVGLYFSRLNTPLHKIFYGIRCHRYRRILDKFSANFSLVSGVAQLLEYIFYYCNPASWLRSRYRNKFYLIYI